MPRFLLINRYRDGEGPEEGTPAHDDEMRAWSLLNRSLGDSGDLVWSLALVGPEEAVACTSGPSGPVRAAGREAAPEGVFALYVVDVPDLAAAERWAARMPTCAYGTVEIRAVMEEVG